MRNVCFNICMFVIALAFSSCTNRPTYYVESGNDTIMSYVYSTDNKKWYVILKDSIVDKDEIHKLFVKADFHEKLLHQAKQSNIPISDEFFCYTKKDAPVFDSCGFDNFYLKGDLFKPLISVEYEYSLDTKAEYEKQQKEINDRMAKEEKKILDSIIKGREPYYGKGLYPVEEYLNEKLADYTYLRSSDIIKKDDNYTVRYVYKTKNVYGTEVIYDKIFTINGTGEVIAIKDYVE